MVPFNPQDTSTSAITFQILCNETCFSVCLNIHCYLEALRYFFRTVHECSNKFSTYKH